MVLKRILFILLSIFLLPLSACTEGPYDYHMRWGRMIGFGYGGVWMWIIFLIVIGILVYVLFKSSKLKDTFQSQTETPLDILKKRYARGEITKEEFDRIRKDLE